MKKNSITLRRRLGFNIMKQKYSRKDFHFSLNRLDRKSSAKSVERIMSNFEATSSGLSSTTKRKPKMEGCKEFLITPMSIDDFITTHNKYWSGQKGVKGQNGNHRTSADTVIQNQKPSSKNEKDIETKQN